MKFSTMVSHRLLDRLIHEVQLSLEIRAGFSVRSNTVVKLKVEPFGSKVNQVDFL